MARPRVRPGAALRQPGPHPAGAAGGLPVRHGALLRHVELVHRPAQRVHRLPQLHPPLGQRRVPPDLPERVRVHQHRGGLQGRARHHPGSSLERAALVQADDPRRGATALGYSHRALHPRLVVDVQLALQRGELDGPGARAHGSPRAELARAEILRDGGGDHRQRVARAAVLCHHHPRRAGGDPQGDLRGRPRRRGGSECALLAHHAADAQAGTRGGGALLHHLHVQRLQHRVRTHPRRTHQLHPPVRDPLPHARDRCRAARRGRRGLALPLPAPGLRRLGLLPFLIFALFPFYHMTLTSLKQDRELYDRFAVPLIITQGPTLEHYTKLLWDTEFLTWTKNSLMVTILATAISVVIGTIAAYALARMRFFGVGAFGTGIFVTYLVPTSLLFLPLAQVVNWIGLADSKWALVLTYPTFLVPFCTWLLMGYFRTVPKEVEECAMVDGATRVQALLRIVLPIAIPGLVCAILFAFTLSWSQFLYALTFTSSSHHRTT